MSSVLPIAPDTKVPASRSIKTVEVMELPELARSGATKYEYSEAFTFSTHVPLTPLSRSKMEKPIMAVEGSTTGTCESVQPYFLRFASLAGPVQLVAWVTTSPKQQQPAA